jgi:hypothetical protein
LIVSKIIELLHTKMGFDDDVRDDAIKEKTIGILRPLIGQYNYENWDDIDAMETGDHVYNSYSLLFKQIHAINYVMMVGSMPVAPTDKHKELCKKITRMNVLQVFFDEITDDEILLKITEHLQPLIAEQLAAEEQARGRERGRAQARARAQAQQAAKVRKAVKEKFLVE